MDENQLMDQEIDMIIEYIKQAQTAATDLADSLKADLDEIGGGTLYKNLQSGDNAKNEISALQYASTAVSSSIDSLITTVANYKNVDWSE